MGYSNEWRRNSTFDTYLSKSTFSRLARSNGFGIESIFSKKKKNQKSKCFGFCFRLTRIFIFFEQSNGRKSLKSLLILNVNEVVVRRSFQILYPINRRFIMKIFRFQLVLFILQQVNRRNEITTNFLIERVANSAQVLVWRPKSGQPTLVVPPKSIEINTSNCNVECRSFLLDFSLLLDAHLPLARY